MQRGSWLTPQLAETLVPALLNTWAKNVQGEYHCNRVQDRLINFVADPHFMAVMSTILQRLASAPVPGIYETVVRQSLPALCEAIGKVKGDDKWIAAAGLELLSGLLQGAPEGNLGGGFIDTLAPALFSSLRVTKDRDAIQVSPHATPVIRNISDVSQVRHNVSDIDRTERLCAAPCMERCCNRQERHRLRARTRRLAIADRG